MESFDVATFLRCAPHWKGAFDYEETMPSTSDGLIAFKKKNKTSKRRLMLADCQTQGRGRRGSPWLSSRGSGLLFSLLYHPCYGVNHWGKIALGVGLAIAECLDTYGVSLSIKWPNDLYLFGKKCGGILCESVEDCVVIGVGLNVLGAPQEDFTSLLEGGRALCRESLLAHLLESIEKKIILCGSQEDFDAMRKSLMERFFLLDKPITFLSGKHSLRGVVRGISQEGHLIVEQQGRLCIYPQAQCITCLEEEESSSGFIF